MCSTVIEFPVKGPVVSTWTSSTAQAYPRSVPSSQLLRSPTGSHWWERRKKDASDAPTGLRRRDTRRDGGEDGPGQGTLTHGRSETPDGRVNTHGGPGREGPARHARGSGDGDGHGRTSVPTHGGERGSGVVTSRWTDRGHGDGAPGSDPDVLFLLANGREVRKHRELRGGSRPDQPHRWREQVLCPTVRHLRSPTPHLPVPHPPPYLPPSTRQTSGVGGRTRGVPRDSWSRRVVPDPNRGPSRTLGLSTSDPVHC